MIRQDRIIQDSTIQDQPIQNTIPQYKIRIDTARQDNLGQYKTL